MAEKVFAKGIRAFKKHDNAPEWVLGTQIISLNELFAWAKGEGKDYLTDYKGEKQLKLQVTKSKDGGLIFSVDTYKADVKAEPKQEVAQEPVKDDDLPF